MSGISIIVPAYNEEKNISLLLEETKKMIESSRLDCELIIVDDGSTDGTYREALSLAKDYSFLRIVRHRRNFGVTEALLTGFKEAKGDIYLFFPADLQYLPQDVPRLVEPLNRGADVVTGWKTGKYEKRLVSSLYNALSRWLFKVPVHDLNSVKAFKKEVVENIPMRKDWHRYMVVLAHGRGYKIEEVRVELYPRRFGTSKFGFFRIPVGFLDLLSVKFQLSFAKKPMLLFGTLGGLSILSGIIAGLIALYLRIFHNFGFRPLLYLTILLILTGLSLLALGFLGESISGVGDRLQNLERRINSH